MTPVCARIMLKFLERSEMNMATKRYESDRTFKEKLQLERDNLKGMSFQEKISHIFTYYRLHMLAVAIVILVCVMIGQIIYNQKFENILYVTVLNGAGGEQQMLEDDIKAYIGDTDEFHEVAVNTSFYFPSGQEADYNQYMGLSTLVGAQEIDVIVMTKEMHDQYVLQDAFIPMDELLTEEQKEAYGDRVSEYGIHIPSNEKLAQYQIWPGDDAYLSVFVYTEQVENAKAFIKFLNEE